MPDVVTYLSARAGQPITLVQLAAGIHAEPTRVQKALSNAISGGAYGTALECVHRGRVWVWRGDPGAAVTAPPPLATPVSMTQAAPAPPEPPPAPPQGLRKGDVVEVMGLTQDGDAVASDENGHLYRVVPL